VLVRQMPRLSRTAAAIHGQAAYWTQDTVLLADVFDVLCAANWQRGGGKTPRPKPYPRPGQHRDRARLSHQLADFRRRHGEVSAHVR
jgi:hypothetical protein